MFLFSFPFLSLFNV
jgi:Na+-driven multidrug efflux pump